MNLDKRTLQGFSFMEMITSQIGVKAFLWGGWLPDIYSNRLLRKHEDMDYLIENLYDCRNKLQQIYKTYGWKTEIISNNDLVITKDKFNIQLGHMEIKKDRVVWFHNGQKGQIVFPVSWLNQKQINFLGIKIHAVKPQFQYILKSHPEFMNPVWKTRLKDKHDLLVLKKLLLQKGVNLSTLEGRMIAVK